MWVLRTYGEYRWTGKSFIRALIFNFPHEKPTRNQLLFASSWRRKLQMIYILWTLQGMAVSYFQDRVWVRYHFHVKLRNETHTHTQTDAHTSCVLHLHVMLSEKVQSDSHMPRLHFDLNKTLSRRERVRERETEREREWERERLDGEEVKRQQGGTCQI